MDEITGKKKAEIDRMLGERGVLAVIVDSRHEGIDVPEPYRDRHVLRLNLSRGYASPPALAEDAIRVRLTFGGDSYACRLPWAAIYAAARVDTEEVAFWFSDTPEEVAAVALMRELGIGPAAVRSRTAAPQAAAPVAEPASRPDVVREEPDGGEGVVLRPSGWGRKG